MSHRRFLRVVLMLVILAIFTSACSSQSERPWLRPPSWSRGLQIGYTPVSTRVTFDLDDADTAYFFHFVGDGNDNLDLQVTALQSTGDVTWEQTIPFNLHLPRHPRIINDGEALQLFWISDQTLYTMRIGLDGEILRQPQQISGQYVAFTVDVLLHPDAGLIVWFGGSRQNPGVYAYAPGDYYGQPELIDELGTRPTLMLDSEGQLHAAWAHDPSGYEERGVYYARYPELNPSATKAVLVSALMPGVSSVLDGPWLGQSGDAVLVLWNLSIVTGLEAGKMTTEYVILPSEDIGDEFQQRPSILYVPSDYHETPRQEATVLQAGERVWLEDVEGAYSPVIQHLSVVSFNGAELVIALEGKVDFLRHKQEFQIGLLFFDAGQPTSYQLLTFDAAASRLPNLVRDDDGYLYLTWIQTADEQGNSIFFATTNPEFSQALSAFDSSDAVIVASNAIFGLFSGVILLPIALIWLLIPLFAIGITSFMRKEDESITGLGTLLGIGLAVVGFWFSKYFTLQIVDGTDYIPFSAWIPQIAGPQADLLRIGVPLLIFIVSIIFAYRRTYAQSNRSVLFFMLFYSILDSLLSLAVYGLLVYGAA